MGLEKEDEQEAEEDRMNELEGGSFGGGLRGAFFLLLLGILLN
jgi:hypothetical protein